MAKVMGIVSFRIYPTLMGGQKGVALFYQHLRRHLDTWLALSQDNELPEGVHANRSLYANKTIFLNLFRIRQLSELVRKQEIDLIIAEHSYTGWIAWRTARRAGKPFLIHSHNIESRRFRQMHKWWWKIYQSYEGWIHRKAHHNFFISAEDQEFAIRNFGLKKEQCSVITYGVKPQQPPTPREAYKKNLGLPTDRPVLLFNGTLDYKPNYEAVVCLVKEIAPLLEKKIGAHCIVVTGNRAPEALVKMMNECSNLVYAGYVADVNEYYRAADLFINPVSNDTGVKTKLIEAIANHCTSLSTEAGASGLIKEICGDKLRTVADGDWENFTREVKKLLDTASGPTPQAFYDQYEWTNIAKKAADCIRDLIRP